ncbi:MAG: TssA family type VI secretion system protein [Candidatus Thiodiazotropha sp.]
MDSAAQPANNESINSLVESLLLPVGESQVGEDPRYGDDFTAVKLEIDRLSDTDYAEIAKLCERILQVESKDLRVAGYYLMARVFNDGLDGLVEGVELYYELVKRYGINCHPQRESAQLQAVTWLNNDKLTAFVNKIALTDIDDRQSVFAVKKHLESLNRILASIYGSDNAIWTSLNPWLAKSLPSEASVQEEVNSTDDSMSHSNNVESYEITSGLVFTRTVERLLDYLAEQGDIARLISVSRAMKWTSSVLPENIAGTTKLSPPRQAVISAVGLPLGLVANDAKLLEYESYFMEAGCQYYLDLQLKEIEVARATGRNDLAELVEFYLNHLVKQTPEILNLEFSDGTPFANEVTRRKLRQTKSSTKQQASTNSANTEADINKRINSILEKNGTENLGAAIDKLAEITARDGSEAYRLDLTRLDLCLNAGRADMALPIALKLEGQVERYRLAEWDKDLALELWDKMLFLLQTGEQGQDSNKTQLEELKRKICDTDLAFALKHL